MTTAAGSVPFEKLKGETRVIVSLPLRDVVSIFREKQNFILKDCDENRKALSLEGYNTQK